MGTFATVGPAAIELGLIKPKADETSIKIRAVNTEGRFVSTVQTPNTKLVYGGETVIDSVLVPPYQWVAFMDVMVRKQAISSNRALRILLTTWK